MFCVELYPLQMDCLHLTCGFQMRLIINELMNTAAYKRVGDFSRAPRSYTDMKGRGPSHSKQ